MSGDVVSLLRDLVAIPSVNPMGRSVSGDTYFEHRVTDYLRAFFERLGLEYRIQERAPLRSNIVAKLDGRWKPEDGGRFVLLEVHQDTVPVEGMTIEPWSASLHDGKVHGRGACDVKGGMASMLVVMERLAKLPVDQRPMVAMACTVDEEFAAVRGVDEVPRLWLDTPSFFPRAPDAAVVAEPTELDVVVAHKGALRWRIHAAGRAAHSSKPAEGDNAIYTMARVVEALRAYADQVVGGLSSHPRLGAPSLSVGIIHGGISVNTVPDHCVIEVDRRLLPGEQHETAYRHVIAFLNERLPDLVHKLRHEPPFLTSKPLSDEGNLELAEELCRCSRQHGGAGRLLGVNFGTDAPPIAETGVPTVVFGPGSIAQAHTADEWIAVDQLHRATEILYQWAACLPGQKRQ